MEWRLLVEGRGSGLHNMGVDEALLATAIRSGAPTLRFYRWDGAWLSLGYAQRLDPARAAACREAGVRMVRRATGGGAVLHGRDLTYSLAAREVDLPEGLAASCALIAEALALGLRSLGVAVDHAAARAPGPRAFDCFAEAGREELCVGGRKLVGSAQRRAAGAVLQHGSLRLAPDPGPARRAAGLGVGATSLAELGAAVAPEAAVAGLARAFGDVLGARLRPGAASPAERERAATRGKNPPVLGSASDPVRASQGAAPTADT